MIPIKTDIKELCLINCMNYLVLLSENVLTGKFVLVRFNNTFKFDVKKAFLLVNFLLQFVIFNVQRFKQYLLNVIPIHTVIINKFIIKKKYINFLWEFHFKM